MMASRPKLDIILEIKVSKKNVNRKKIHELTFLNKNDFQKTQMVPGKD